MKTTEKGIVKMVNHKVVMLFETLVKVLNFKNLETKGGLPCI